MKKLLGFLLLSIIGIQAAYATGVYNIYIKNNTPYNVYLKNDGSANTTLPINTYTIYPNGGSWLGSAQAGNGGDFNDAFWVSLTYDLTPGVSPVVDYQLTHGLSHLTVLPHTQTVYGKTCYVSAERDTSNNNLTVTIKDCA